MRAAAWARASTEGLCFLLFLALPAAFNPLGGQPIDPVKASLLRCLAALIATTWVASRLLGAAPLTNVGAQPIVRAGLIVFGATTLSTLLSINPGLSFFGSYYREMGWLTLAAGVVLLIAGADLWSDVRRRERAVTAVLVGAILPGAYALVQRFGHDPVPWRNLGGPASTFGSPTFLGAFLVVVAPFAMYRFATSAQTLASGETRRWTTLSYAGYLVFVLTLAAIVTLTTIRGPLIALVAEVVVFALVIAGRLPHRVRRLAWAAAGAFVAVTLALSVAAAGAAGLQGVARFLGVPRPGDSSPNSAILSASDRLIVWSAAVPLPLVDPLRAMIGFGPEMQLPVLQRAESVARTTPTEGGQWDRAHDVFIDTWLTGGALGVLALLAVVATVGRTMWRVAREGTGQQPLLAAAILAGIVGHLVEASFSFETVVTSALFWVLVALAAGLTPVRAASAIDESRQAATRRTPHKAVALGAAGLAALLLMPTLWAPAVADNVYGRATRAQLVGAAQSAAQRAESAASWAPWVEEMPRLAGLSWQQVGLQRAGESGEQLLGRAEGQLREAIRRGPYDPFAHLRLARLYLAWARRAPVERSADELLGQAEQACALALSDSPYRPSTWQACAEISRERGQVDEAATRTERARQLGGQT